MTKCATPTIRVHPSTHGFWQDNLFIGRYAGRQDMNIIGSKMIFLSEKLKFHIYTSHILLNLLILPLSRRYPLPVSNCLLTSEQGIPCLVARISLKNKNNFCNRIKSSL